MEPRGRGRSKGRARGTQPTTSQQRPGGSPAGPPRPNVSLPGVQTAIPPRPAPSQPGVQPTGPPRPASSQPRVQPTGPPRPVPGQPPAAPGQGVWGRPPLPKQAQVPVQPQPASHWVRPPITASAPVIGPVGRGSRKGAAAVASGDQAEIQSVVESGASGKGGNGGVRGRGSFRNEIIYTRPQNVTCKKGSSGQTIRLLCNYFQLLQVGKWGLFQYRVDFSPDVDNTKERKSLMYTAMKEVVNGYLFDGTVMYTPRRLMPDPMEKFVQNHADENIRITVRMVGDLAWGDRAYLQLFNLIIRKCLVYMKLELVGRDYYDPALKVNLPEHKLQLWPGYYTSIRQHEHNILMNCDQKFKMLRLDNVYDMMLECKSSDVRKEFSKKVMGCIVLTNYNNKTYRVDDIDYKSNPKSTFTLKDGTETTYVDYYQKRYNIKIHVLEQPILVSRSKPREIRSGMPDLICLIPELCQMTGLSDKQRENFHLMKALADHTRMAPAQRIQKLKEFSERMRACPQVVEELRRWDLSFADSLLKITGRVLPQEEIAAGGSRRYQSGEQADWTRELRSSSMFIEISVPRLAVIVPRRFKNSCQDFIQCLMKAARGMRWDLAQPRVFEINNDEISSYLDCIENVLSNNPTMIMSIIQTNAHDRYSAIKKKCSVDRGIPSQIITTRSLTHKGVMSIATKVAIQLNCKAGGAPWAVVMPLTNVMVVGYDVCRDTMNKKLSFSGMVASLDKALTRYYNFACKHELEEELSSNFASFMVLACEKFKEVNKQYPDRIIIYRDGVGVGQLPYVVETEVQSIRKRLTAEIYKTKELRLAFIVVSKRINTKIFAQSGNPPPGTIVDDVITYPERYDFYLISQCVRQGTVAPTSYNVLTDDSGLGVDKLQVLTYKLCHMYYNWSGTVRVPAPCQYAHKLAFLTAQHLHRTAHRALETLLFYL